VRVPRSILRWIPACAGMAEGGASRSFAMPKAQEEEGFRPLFKPGAGSAPE